MSDEAMRSQRPIEDWFVAEREQGDIEDAADKADKGEV